MTRKFIAMDPGREKCGLAVMDEDARVLEMEIVAPAELPARVAHWKMSHPAIALCVIGGGTGYKPVVEGLKASGVPDAQIRIIREYNTTMLAREKYFEKHPPRGILRLLPRGLRVPPRPVDDFAAVVIGEIYLKETGETGHAGHE